MAKVLTFNSLAKMIQKRISRLGYTVTLATNVSTKVATPYQMGQMIMKAANRVLPGHTSLPWNTKPLVINANANRTKPMVYTSAAALLNSKLLCICNCYYCTCNCNYCVCNCNYCTCNCNYCVCNCNYSPCSCNCNNSCSKGLGR